MSHGNGESAAGTRRTRIDKWRQVLEWVRVHTPQNSGTSLQKLKQDAKRVAL